MTGTRCDYYSPLTCHALIIYVEVRQTKRYYHTLPYPTCHTYQSNPPTSSKFAGDVSFFGLCLILLACFDDDKDNRTKLDSSFETMALSTTLVAKVAIWRVVVLLCAVVTQGQVCTVDQVLNDSCQWQVDGECDAGVVCDAGTDCVDCDPCFAQSGTDCATCTGTDDGFGNSCLWCPHWDASLAYCFSPTFAEARPATCNVSPGYTAECPSCNVPYDDQVQCSYNYNKVCDVGESVFYGSVEISGRCGTDTDCMDCDPCHAYDSTDCETCTSNGCAWCSGDAVCWSPNLAPSTTGPFVNPSNPINGFTSKFFSCSATEDYAFEASQCATVDEDNFFSDPLYGANTWVFDLINVRPVWEAGYSKYSFAMLLLYTANIQSHSMSHS